MPGPTPEPPPLILASRSPRRAELLRDAGYAFSPHAPPFDDPDQPDTPKVDDPECFAADLALRKALSLAESLGPVATGSGAVVLAADTLCVAGEGRLLGKPVDRDDLLKMLAGFVNATHDVVTGVALVCLPSNRQTAGPPDPPISLADTAAVTWGDVTLAERQRYADTEVWRGKAGGYNLHDRLGAGWPIKVVGDPATVTGLPMRKLAPVLAELGVAPAFSASSPPISTSRPSTLPR